MSTASPRVQLDDRDQAELDALPLMFKIPELARLARVSRNRVYEAVATGQLPALRLGRTIRIPRAAGLRWLGLDRDGAAGLEPRTKAEEEAQGLGADL